MHIAVARQHRPIDGIGYIYIYKELSQKLMVSFARCFHCCCGSGLLIYKGHGSLTCYLNRTSSIPWFFHSIAVWLILGSSSNMQYGVQSRRGAIPWLGESLFFPGKNSPLQVRAVFLLHMYKYTSRTCLLLSRSYPGFSCLWNQVWILGIHLAAPNFDIWAKYLAAQTALRFEHPLQESRVVSSSRKSSPPQR